MHPSPDVYDRTDAGTATSNQQTGLSAFCPPRYNLHHFYVQCTGHHFPMLAENWSILLCPLLIILKNQ